MLHAPRTNAVYLLALLPMALTAARNPEVRPPAVGAQHMSPTTYAISADRYFHVDDFAGLSPLYTPLQGFKSLWCGRRADPALCWLADGYPTNSVQIFESKQFPANGYVQVDFLAAWSVEESYDFIYVEARSNTQDWQSHSYTGSGNGLQSVETVASAGGWVQFRVKLVSDAIVSGEDGGWPYENSGIVIDSLTVRDGSGTVIDFQSFETEAVGATETTDGDWYTDPVYEVSSTADSGPGTLRDAIAVTNASTSINRIVFNIPGAGPHSIQPWSALPATTDYVVIDGFTQPGATPNTNPLGGPVNSVLKIELSGIAAGAMSNGLLFQAPGKVRGLAINHWGRSGVRIESSPVFVEGNYLGPDITGLTAGGPNGQGVTITGSANRVGGCSPAALNIIGGNSDGVLLDGCSLAQVKGNYIGPGADFVTPLPNTYGVHIQGAADRNKIGWWSSYPWPTTEPFNVIAHNGSFGILVDGTTPTGNTFFGNSVHEDFRAIEVGNAPPPEASEIHIDTAVGSLISGQITGPPSKPGRIQFFRSSECGGPWGTGYAETFVSYEYQNSGPTGTALFSYTLPQPLPPGCWITATVTFPSPLNTSELSVCRQYQNTPGGDSVVVNLLDDDLNARGSVTYEAVDSPGNTYLQNPWEPREWLSGPFFVPETQNPAIYFEVTTDAVVGGPITVCLNYDENNLPGKESQIVLVHYDGSKWADVTTSVDTVNNRICGEVSSLSPFVIAVPVATGIGDASVPVKFALAANIPNPFNPQTTIHYDIPAGGADVNLSIYDVAGRLVRELVNEHRAAGTWSVQWNGDDERGQRVASGVYFYRMHAGDFVEKKKMVLLK